MFHAAHVRLASAADYSWNGSTGAWNSLNWTIPPSATAVAGPTGATGTNSATITAGTVTFAGNDTFGAANTSASAVINLNGGTLASGGFFNTLWNLNLGGGTLLANGGAAPQFPAFQLPGTVTVSGSAASLISVGGGSNNAVNLGGTGNAITTFNVANVTGDAAADLTIGNVLQSNDSTAGLTKTGAGTLVITNSTTYRGPTTVNGGVLRFTGGSGMLSGSGAITISGGTLDFGGGSQTTVGVVTLSNGSTLTGGTLTRTGAGAGNLAEPITGSLTIGANSGYTTSERLLLGLAGTKALTLSAQSAGSLTFGGDATNTMNYIGVGGGANATLTVNGGSVNFTNATPGTGNGYVNVGSNADTATGAVVVNGGNVNVGTWLKLGGSFSSTASNSATASLSVASGTVSIGGGDAVTLNGVLFLNGGNGDATANTGNTTLAINSGGVLEVAQIQAGNSGTRTFTIDGGTLRARAGASSTFVPAATGLAVAIGSGGATIDSNGNTVTVAAPLSGSGSLTKAGAGLLTLSGASGHSGTTRVAAGGLAVGAASTLASSTLDLATADSGTVTFNQNSTLGGLAGSRNLDLATRTVSIGNGNGLTTYSGQLSNGTLTKVGSGTLALTGANANATTIVTAGVLRLSGGSDRLSTSGAITLSGGTLDLDGGSQATSGVVTLSNGSVLTGGTLARTGAGLGGLAEPITGALTVGANSGYVTTERLLLGLASTKALTLSAQSAGTLTFGGDSANNMNYIGVGGGANATLTVNGGSVNFTNAATGTGNGYLNVASNAGTATGALVVSGGNLTVGTWLKLGGNFNTTAGTDATSSLSVASGTVSIGGGSDTPSNGVLFLNGGNGDATANTGNSTVTVSAGGVLAVKQIQAGNGGTKTINLNGGTILAATGANATFLPAATGLTATVGNAGVTFDTNGNTITVATSLVNGGSGGLVKNGAGTLGLTGTNTYAGSTQVNAGTLTVAADGALGSTAGGTVVASGAQLRFASSTGSLTIGNEAVTIGGTGVTGGGAMRSAADLGAVDVTWQGTVTLAADASIGAAANTSLALDVASGNAIEAANYGLTFDGAGVTSVLDAIALGTGGLTKIGSGTTTLWGDNTYGGTTTVSLGTLLINGNQSAATGALSVASGATLGGSGTIGGAVSILGGVVAPGNSPGTLTILDSFALAGTSVLNFELSGTNNTVGGGVNDLITGVTNLTVAGVLNVTALDAFTSVTAGTSWRLFNYTGSFTDNGLTLGSMPTLADGYSFELDTATVGQVNLVAVPEPSAIALAVVGLGFLGWHTVRRRVAIRC